MAAAGQLPAQQGGDLLTAAREAFSAGLHVVGVVTAVFYAGLAVLSLWAFRRVRTLSGRETSDEEDQDAAVGLRRPSEATSRSRT